MPFRKLIEGYRKFHKVYFESAREKYESLAVNGQSPEVLIIACSDSRIDPAIVTECEPGEAFVVRNVAAIVPPYRKASAGSHHGTSAAIEFAVKGLKVKHIIVMGHALCGGIRALADKATTREQYEFLGEWVHICEEAKKLVEQEMAEAPPEKRLPILEQAVILTSLHNLMTFPWIREGVENGKIILHGWYFDFRQGLLAEYDSETASFKNILTSPSGCGAKDICGCESQAPIAKFLRQLSLKAA